MPFVKKEKVEPAFIAPPVVLVDGKMQDAKDPDPRLAASAYKVMSKLGQGAFAEVYYATVNERKCAVKVANLGDKQAKIQQLSDEVRIMQTLRHPNVVGIHACFSVGQQLWIAMDLGDGGSLRSVLDKRFPSGVKDMTCIASIAKNILQGLEYLHHRSIVHRDLKAENIIISSTGNVKVADMGISLSLMKDGKLRPLTEFAGTQPFMAPEVCDAKKSYDTAADIWSFGIMMLEISMGFVQWGKPDNIAHRIITGPPVRFDDYMSHAQAGLSKSFKDFVNSCLHMDPSKRPDCHHLLKHKFLTKAAKSKQKLVEILRLEPLKETQFLTLRGLRRHEESNSGSEGIRRTTETERNMLDKAQADTANCNNSATKDVDATFASLWLPSPDHKQAEPSEE